MAQEPNELAEGDVIEVINQGVYVIQGGKKLRIPDMGTFYEKGLDKKKAKIIYPKNDVVITKNSTEYYFMNLPGTNWTPPLGSISFNFQSDVGDAPSHNMHTWGSFNPQNAWLAAVTRTWVTNLVGGGFHGLSRVLFYDANGELVTWSQGHRFGAGSGWDLTGPSDRTDPWGEYIQGEINRVKSLSIVHSWEPDPIERLLQKGKQYAVLVGEAVQKAVKVSASFFLL
jgi:hypothetical protein